MWLDPLRSKGLLQRGAKRMLEPYEPETPMFPMNLQPLFENEDDWLAASSRDVDWYYRNLLKSKQHVYAFPHKVVKKRGTQALKDKPRITVGTIHSVKGGQAKCVWLMPDLSPSAMREWQAKGKSRDNIVRTIYVGMTRASESLTICKPASHNAVHIAA
jgi:ATP-dependent exoDNAse (exonuclease V) beta subunit